MQSIDESYQDLWSGLESEFEEKESTPLDLDLPGPPGRQRTIGVANLQSLFSGYYPVLVLCLAGVLLGLGETSGQSISLSLGATGLLAFVLAGFLAPALRGPRRAWWYYSLTAILIGGVAELSVVVSQGLLAFVVTPTAVSATSLVYKTQQHLESYYTFWHWAVYVALGAGVGLIMQRLQKRAPWMDSPSTGKFRGILLTALLAFPLLLPVSCFVIGTIQRKDTGWLRYVEYRNPDLPGSRLVLKVDKEWGDLQTYWVSQTQDVERPGERISKTSVPLLHELERRYLLLAQKENAVRSWGGDRYAIEELFSERRDDLNQPLQVALWSVRFRMYQHRNASHEERLVSRWEFLLSELAESQLTARETLALKAQLKDYDEHYLRPRQEGNRWVYSQMTSYQPSPKPLTLFGVPFEHSPQRLHMLYDYRFLLGPWQQLQDDIPFNATDEEYWKHIKQQDQLRWLSSKPFDYELRPLWRAAAVISAAKLHKSEHGDWPESASEIQGRLWFAPDYSFTQVPDGLQIRDNSSDRSWIVK